jgi:predicted nucleic acid-binding Zn ribbon protein
MPDLDDHRHCKVCGKITGPEKEYCSRACREKREQTLRSRRNYTLVLYATMVFLLLLFLLNFLRI